MQTFTCHFCQETLPARDLSLASLRRARTKNRVTALRRLTRPVCDICDAFLQEDSQTSAAPVTHSNHVRLSFDLDGVTLTDGQMSALQQNW